MKIYISVDIEGITGVNSTKFLGDGQPEYYRGRNLMMQDLNTAIEGALEAGATEILVNDAHGSMRNLFIEDLHEAADLITGFPKNNLMLTGLDESFDAVIFIGYHAKEGSKGILSHTLNIGVFEDIKINEKSYGETGLNAAIAGHYNVPIVMISGDDVLRKEALDILPDVKFAITKERKSLYAGKMLNAGKTKKLIKEKVKNGLLMKDNFKIFNLGESLNVEVKFKSPLHADVIEIIPGIKRISPTTVTYSAKDILEVGNILNTISNACCVLYIGLY